LGYASLVAELHAQFPSASSSVGKARRAIIAFARQWFSGDELTDIESAVGEALANCAEHGHVNGTDIDVRCRYDGHELCVEIKDAGQGFERWNTCEGAKPLANALRGYGTYIMRRLMDEIEYTERGTRIRLVKRVAGARSAAAGEQAERTEMFG
jgi:anti-sigma regulatory factor (Ser/Thr protein kinase)